MPTAGLWIGAHATDASGAFTGVTTAWNDFSQGFPSNGKTEFTPVTDVISRRSSLPASPFYDPSAVSEMDYLCTYDDLVLRATGGETHRPLKISVRQTVHTWTSFDLAHVVFTRLAIRNLGDPLTDLWVGIYSELASGNKNAYATWQPTSSGGPGSWYGKAWLQYDADLRLLREHYCRALPVPDSCHFEAAPPWIGLKVLTPPSPGQTLTLWADAYSPGDATRDQDVERYALMSAGTIANLTLPPG